MLYPRPHKLFLALVLWMAIPLVGLNDPHIDTIYFKMEKHSFYKGRTTVTIADIYFTSENGTIVKNYIQPDGKIAITDRKGELALYDKKNNQVFYEQNPDYNTEDNILFFILSRNVSAEGFNDMGFQFKSNEFDEDRAITKWMPPRFMKHLFNYVEITYRDQMPFFASYYDTNENLLVKTYFTDYESYPELNMPLTLTEFVYVNENDSIINQVKLTDIKINDTSKNDFFDFEIPGDAEILE